MAKCQLVICIFLVCCSLDAPVAAGQGVAHEIFLVGGDGQQWCGYTSKVKSRADAEEKNSTIVVGVLYVGERLTAVHVTEGDESGDWNVDDRYSLNNRGGIVRLDRVVDNFSVGVTQHEVFKIEGGRAVRQAVRSKARRTGEPVKELSGDYLPDVPVVTEPRSFPFWSFLVKQRQNIRTNGRACSGSAP